MVRRKSVHRVHTEWVMEGGMDKGTEDNILVAGEEGVATAGSRHSVAWKTGVEEGSHSEGEGGTVAAYLEGRGGKEMEGGSLVADRVVAGVASMVVAVGRMDGKVKTVVSTEEGVVSNSGPVTADMETAVAVAVVA